MIAIELNVPHSFVPVFDITALDAAAFAGNPALKIPVRLVTHLPFRQVLDVTPWPRLKAFCQAFGERPSARETEYHYDTP